MVSAQKTAAPPTDEKPNQIAPKETAEEMAMLVGHARKRLRVAMERELASAGEELAVWFLLRNLVRHGPLPQNQLASCASLDPASVSRLLDGMERRGLVRRARDPRDRRRVMVAPGPKAARRLVEVNPAVSRAVDGLLAPLTERESRQLRALLRKVLGEP
jgi:DNA-binding MarR family transcriptional regulator